MEHFGDNKFLLKVMGQPVHRQLGILGGDRETGGRGLLGGKNLLKKFEKFADFLLSFYPIYYSRAGKHRGHGAEQVVGRSFDLTYDHRELHLT